MSDTINIGGITVSKFYLGGSSDVKIYLGTTKLYPHLQEPCFAVVADISQYSDREFVDVFNQADGKWYKLNNLNQYEEYGVYGSGRNITTYEGKLTIDGGYEYIYSGSSWQNVGEVSGSTATLPDIDFSINYNAANYISTAYTIPQTEGQLQNVDAVCNYGYKIVDHSADGYISVTGNSRFVCNGNSGTYLNRSNTQANCPMTIVSKAKTTSGYSIFTNRTASARQYMYRQDKTYAYLCGSGATSEFTCSDTVPNVLSVRVYYDGGIKAKWNNWTTSASSTPEVYGYNNQNLTNGGALFCDYTNSNSEFWQGDFYWIYMSQNALTDEQVQQVITYNEGGGGEPTYPLYYDEMQDPPNNVTFTSMTEAEEYECPWVGMIATIDGVKYIFSGDSQSGYEWVAKPSRLPVGYTEVEYVENQDMACINTGFKPNQNTRLITEMQTVSTTSYVNHFGAGGWNEPNALILDYETNYNGTLHLTWGTATGWTVVSSVRGDYDKHTYDWNKNEVYRDDTLVKTFTYGNYQAVSNLYIFTTINNGSSTPQSVQEYYMKGKLYSLKIYDNGTLVRDMIPCTRDSDSKAGVYDIVNDVFYSSANSGYGLVAGPTI